MRPPDALRLDILSPPTRQCAEASYAKSQNPPFEPLPQLLGPALMVIAYWVENVRKQAR